MTEPARRPVCARNHNDDLCVYARICGRTGRFCGFAFSRLVRVVTVGCAGLV